MWVRWPKPTQLSLFVVLFLSRSTSQVKLADLTMLCRIIFCSAVSLALLAVLLLAFLSPVPNKNQPKPLSSSWLALSLYIQQPRISGSNGQVATAPLEAGAFVFHHTLTEGPENTSRVVGKARGFIIPDEGFAHSAFNIIYLTFNTPDYPAGSLCVQAKHVAHEEKQLNVVGGTGSFAFARGVAVFAETEQQSMHIEATYHVKLQLRFSNHSRSRH